MAIQIKPIYEPFQESDGIRLLVDRVWPRGISKEKSHLDGWLKELAPSTVLRRWFGHIPEKFPQFSEQYRKELDANPQAQTDLLQVIQQSRQHTVTLLYGAKNQQFNQAVVLKAYLDDKMNAMAS